MPPSETCFRFSPSFHYSCLLLQSYSHVMGTDGPAATSPCVHVILPCTQRTLYNYLHGSKCLVSGAEKLVYYRLLERWSVDVLADRIAIISFVTDLIASAV